METISIESEIPAVALDRGIDLDSLDESHPRKRALVIDDETETVNLIKFILTNAGMDVAGAPGGATAVERIPHIWPDVILLDLMMPDMDGFETFRRLRRVTSAPVIIISAKNREEDVVAGLQAGADDYIAKPFHPGELIARVNTSIRRFPAGRPRTIFEFPEISFSMNTETHEVTVRGRTLSLPPREFNILKALVGRAGNWVHQSTLAREVWGQEDTRTLRRIKYQIFLLRRRLEENPSRHKLIVSREGLGYKLAV